MKYRKVSNEGGDIPSLFSRHSTLAIAIKKHKKVDIKCFLPCRILLDFFTLLQILQSSGLIAKMLKLSNT